MNSTSSSTERPTHEQISERAKAIWQERGQPVGMDDQIWLEAERQVAEELQASEPVLPQAVAPLTAAGLAGGAMSTAAFPQAVPPLPVKGIKKRSKNRA